MTWANTLPRVAFLMVLEYSDDWEVIEITMPAEFETRDEPRDRPR